MKAFSQGALVERARMNSEASMGVLRDKESESGAAASTSLHVAGGNRY